VAYARRKQLRGLAWRTCDYKRAWRALERVAERVERDEAGQAVAVAAEIEVIGSKSGSRAGNFSINSIAVQRFGNSFVMSSRVLAIKFC